MSGILAVVMDALMNLRDSLRAASPEITQTAGAMLITAIWQGAVVATCVAICLKLTNRISASLRFAVWAAGFLTVAALPFFPLLLRMGAGAGAQPVSSLAEASSAAEPWLRLDIRWSIALTVIWVAASLYRLVDLAVHSVRLRSLWKTATPVEFRSEPDSLSSPSLPPSLLLRGRKPVEICTTNALDRPSVIGFLAPRILIPEWLYAQLTPGELQQIMLHETEHLRRGDDWTNLLQKLSLIVFPLNPVLLWMERQLCLEREMACDEAVVRATGAPRAYAACLTSLAERGVRRRAEALSLGAWQRRPELVRRVHRILRRRQALGPLSARGVLTVMACGLVFGTVELSRCPQLIAFTQAPVTETTQAHPLASQEIPVGMPFRMVDTRFVEPPQAVMPPATGKTHPAESTPKRLGSSGKCQHVNLDSVTGALAAQPTPSFASHTAPRQELNKSETEAKTADASGNFASSPVNAPQEQSWVVLTTWEEVAPSALDAAQSDQASVSSSDPAAEQPAKKFSQQHAGQVKVTQLIFRVVPASSPSHSPTAIPVRGGWLVIQL